MADNYRAGRPVLKKVIERGLNPKSFCRHWMSMSMREKQVPQGQTTFRPCVELWAKRRGRGGWSLFKIPTVTIKTAESQAAMLHSLKFERVLQRYQPGGNNGLLVLGPLGMLNACPLLHRLGMQTRILSLPAMEGPVCLRCLLRLSRRGRGRGPRLFSQFSTTSNTIEATSLFQRNYFSANRTDASIKCLAESTLRATGKLRGDSSEGLVLASQLGGQLHESSSGEPSVSDGTELPHRRRKRLKTEQGLVANVPDTIPPDASSRLSTMSTTLPPSSLRRLLSLYLSLSKPRLSFLIVLTTAAAYSLYPVPALLLPQTTASPSLSTLTLVFLTSGTALCSASANALNMLMEPEHDAKMSRTRNRPLVRGYVGKGGALVFATIAGAVGIGSLYLGVNPTVAFLGGLNIFLYAGVYTPMKRISVLNTWVGAVVGGIPPLMGWAAAAGQSASGSGNWEELLFSEGSIGGWLLAALLYAWQFPHFNALSWTIRDEYKHAGYRMLAWVNPRMNGRVAFRYAVLSFPICGALWWFGITDQGFLITSSVVNTWIVREAWHFWRKDGHKGSARALFWAGVWHLPVIMVLAMVHKKGLFQGVWQRLNGQVPEDDLWTDEEELFVESGQQVRAPLRITSAIS
ncbi:MAG: hypothetical protein Q9210_001889 [Variospora velana]